MGIGRRIDIALNHKNLKVSDLANAVGVRPQRIYNIIKRDTRTVDNELLDQIAKAMDLPITYFTSLSEPNSFNKYFEKVHYIDYSLDLEKNHSKSRSKSSGSTNKYEQLRYYFAKLNVEGKDEAIKRVAELSQLDKYKNKFKEEE